MMETRSFSQLPPKEKRKRVFIVLLLLAVTVLVCAGIFKLGGPYAKMESGLRAWGRGKITDSEIKAKLDGFIRGDDYLRQVWAAKKLIALGVPGSESIIESVLTEYSGKSRVVANLMLNCGNGSLSAFARQWAIEHGYELKAGRGGPKATWGGR